MQRCFSIIVVVVFSTFSISCGTEKDSTTPESAKSTFRYVNGPEPRTIDPALLTDSYGAYIAQNIFEGLVVWNSSGDNVEPGIAQSWSVSADGLSWTFELRAEARWSNGEKVTAADFVNSWRRVLNPDTNSDYASLLFPIRGARDLYSGNLADPSKVGIRAEGDRVLVVELERPEPDFLFLAATAVYLPVNARSLKRSGWEWTRPGNIVCNGPFLLTQWIPEDRFVLEANPYYWDRASVKLDEVIAYSAEDAERVLELWNTGSIDWSGPATDSLFGDNVRNLESFDDFHRTNFLGTWALLIRVDEEPLSNKHLRQALSLALDRDSIAASVGPGTEPAYSLVPKGLPGYEPSFLPKRSVERAKRMWKEHNGPSSFEVAVDRRSLSHFAVQQVVDQWSEVLGVNVTLFEREWRLHTGALSEGAFQVGRWAWAGDYLAPDNFLSVFSSDSGLNNARYNNMGFDRLLDAAARAPDRNTRYSSLRDAEEVLLADLPVIPVFHLTSSYLLHDRVLGFEHNLLNYHPLKELNVQ